MKCCRKCLTKHQNEGDLCGFCQNDANKEKARQAKEAERSVQPSSFWVECTVKREGGTSINLGPNQYHFLENDHGHYVCEVKNLVDYRYLITRAGSHLRAYEVSSHDEG
jgi:hypothetical protein